ncbi:hypothetical protein SHK09_00800 [Polaribacter sp. PL03]|uniref:hypothetical protein n=1 Tax=Polaribacter sp. PL03 TaxID=3088353 RepID=UPI0029D1974B|nr:hypothetical protein [Polaribacter sp. PL03]MDX6745313.1 hypothetical protein [Polaribacter sp. PL03]
MILQILPPEGIIVSESFFDTQLLFVILGMAAAVFVIIKGAKLLSKINISKTVKKPSYTS